MKEAKELDKVVKKMAAQIKGVRKLVRVKIPPKKKA